MRREEPLIHPLCCLIQGNTNLNLNDEDDDGDSKWARNVARLPRVGARARARDEATRKTINNNGCVLAAAASWPALMASHPSVNSLASLESWLPDE